MNLCGTTFPLSKQSVQKLVFTLKGSHFCGENFTEKGTTRWQFSPPSSKEGYLREGLRSPPQRLNILIQNIAVLYLPFLFCQYKCI